MAVANTKSTSVTNQDATPKLLNSSYFDNGMVRESVGTVEVAVADDDNSVFRFHRLSSSARIKDIQILNDAITGGTDYNLGLYDPAIRGGAVVDDNLFGDAITMASARVAPLHALYEALDIANNEKRIWELLGLLEDPFLEYDLALTAITVGAAAGTISISSQFVI